MDTEQEITALKAQIEEINQHLTKSDYLFGNHKHTGSDLSQPISFKRVTLNIGNSTAIGNAGASLFDHYATVGNTTTSETNLYSDTVLANTFGTNGDKIQLEYGGSFVSSGTATREVKLYFGGTQIFDTGALTLSLSAAWTMYGLLIRVSPTVIRYMISFTTEGAALAAYTAVGELTGLVLSNDNIVKITGQASGVGAATNDITAKLGDLIWYPAV